MGKLRSLGCGIALDDFGTGLSSLSYLRELPVTMLKIDGSFVRDVIRDPRAESMVRAIAQLARTMSLATVAEYVETKEILARVATLGVDYGQGFAIARPVPLDDLLVELTASGDAARSSGAWPRASLFILVGSALPTVGRPLTGRARRSIVGSFDPTGELSHVDAIADADRSCCRGYFRLFRRLGRRRAGGRPGRPRRFQ